MDLENAKPELTPSAAALEETQRSYAQHKEQYEKLRSDVAVKMQFLDENRVSTTFIKYHSTGQNKPNIYPFRSK